MASERDSNKVKTRLTDYLYISKVGIPVCRGADKGLSRKIQQQHISKEFCLHRKGRYRLRGTGSGEITDVHHQYPCTPDHIKTVRRRVPRTSVEEETSSHSEESLQSLTVHGASPVKHEQLTHESKGKSTTRKDPDLNKITRRRKCKCYPVNYHCTVDSVWADYRGCGVNEYKGMGDDETLELSDSSSMTEHEERLNRSKPEDLKTCETEERVEECKANIKHLAELQKRVRDTISADSQLPAYEDVLDKYGWKAQIPGDPFNLKPISEKLPYYVKIPYQSLEVKWPANHRHFYSPIFYNTIQSMKRSYIIEKSLLSEQLEGRQGVKVDTVYR